MFLRRLPVAGTARARLQGPLRFLAGVPRGADAYLLRVLHDWGDDDALRGPAPGSCGDGGCRRWLSTVSSALRNEDPLTKFLDVKMLVSARGRERTAVEWISMLDAAGFRLNAVVQADPGRSVLDAVPAS
jgi:hypothetical protein